MNKLSQGNLAFRKKNYSDALDLYNQFATENPHLKESIKTNIEITNRRLILDQKKITSDNKNLKTDLTFKYRIDKADKDIIRGWCVKNSNPNEIFNIEILVDGQFYSKIKNNRIRPDLKKNRISEGNGGFEFVNPIIYFNDGQHTISIRLPDGTFINELIFEAPPPENNYSNTTENFKSREITIIVPIYNAAEDLDICIKRIIENTTYPAKIILIDDASTDKNIKNILNKYKNNEFFRILHNDLNLGFTKTVNRGILESGQDDVILLNSDARVTPGWLQSMMIAAYSQPYIATVTAMSDRAGAFSAPEIGNENSLPEGVDEENYARAFRKRSLGLYPKVPTGNGFCMYIRRECINKIGVLDEVAFPRGYGEENDFCMRAWRAGWSNIIDDRTYVFHDRSKSFGESKNNLMQAGRSVIDQRYPEYKIAIKVFSTCPKIALARNRARLAIEDCKGSFKKKWIPLILFVTATQTGGTPQTNKDLMLALSDLFEGWILRCDSKTLELSRMNSDGSTKVIRSKKLQEPIDPLTHSSSEYDYLITNWIKDFDFEIIHIRHLGWHGINLPKICKNLGKKLVFSFHDFYTISSTIKLVDDRGIYRGDTYFEEPSIFRESLWPKDTLPTPDSNWLNYWQAKFQAALVNCDAFVTTADSARDLVLSVMPEIPAERFFVIPHGRDFNKFYRIRQKPTQNEPIRILVPGNVNALKGLEVIKSLIEYDKLGKLEFHILGELVGDKPNRGIVTWGSYERNDFAEKASQISPHIGIIFSIWDETYCHTLTELWSVGLPVAVLDFPNLSNRVRKCGAGWILDQNNIEKLYKDIINISFDENEYIRTEEALENWQNGYGLANNTTQMAAGYFNIYSDLLTEGFYRKKSLSSHSRKRIGMLWTVEESSLGNNTSAIETLNTNDFSSDVIYIKMNPDVLVSSAQEKLISSALINKKLVNQSMLKYLTDKLSLFNTPYSLID